MSCKPFKAIGSKGELIEGLMCSRGGPRCKSCNRPATCACEFPLRGVKEGKACGILLCDRCAYTVTVGRKKKFYCRAHAELKR